MTIVRLSLQRASHAALVFAALIGAGCGSSDADRDYVARLGDEVLTETDLQEALSTIPPGLDAETARAQFVEQWVTNHLLAREARRRGLLDQPDVQRQLKENEQSVLAAALLGQLYDEDEAAFSRAELEAYFERNKDRMRLRDTYVRVRFVEAATEAAADRARGEMIALYTESLEPPQRDSIFAETARRFAIDTTASLALSGAFVPQSRLAQHTGGATWTVVAQLGPRETSPVAVTADSTYFVVQLVERAAAGTEPRMEWVAEEVQRRLAIQNRQQVVAREVQRLRTEALARGDLRLPGEEGL